MVRDKSMGGCGMVNGQVVWVEGWGQNKGLTDESQHYLRRKTIFALAYRASPSHDFLFSWVLLVRASRALSIQNVIGTRHSRYFFTQSFFFFYSFRFEFVSRYRMFLQEGIKQFKDRYIILSNQNSLLRKKCKMLFEHAYFYSFL